MPPLSPFAAPYRVPAASLRPGTSLADALLADAGAALVRGEVPEARRLCARARGHLAGATEPAQVAGALARLEARICLTDGDPDAALDALAAALAIAEATNDVRGAAHAFNHVAIVNFARGQLDEAQANYEAARARARRVGERAVVAATTLNLGAIANIRGEVRRAISSYQRAITEFRAIGREHDVAAALNNLGMARADLGQWEGAVGAFDEALAITIRIGDTELQTRLHVNVAETWIGRGDLARAQIACNAAFTATQATPQSHAAGEAHKLAGIIARECGDLDRAESAFRQAEDVARARQDLLLLAETAREQADLHRRQSRNRDTLQALNRAHRLFEQLRARRDLADIGRRMNRLENDFVGVARRWGESIEAADRYTQGHCQRVADLACLIAEKAGLDSQALFWFRIGALLHDVGKLVIPADVLNKPGKLTDDEFALMRSHTTEGVRMLADIEFPWDVRPIVLSHHERWDGRGYPHGLAGEAIPLTARILCVADVYDALTSVRSYKRALTHDEAMAILRKDAGTAFDPQVFEWFESVAPAWASRTSTSADEGQTASAGEAETRATRQAAGLDPVTGLPPRDLFYDECRRVLGARVDDGRPTGLVVIRAVDAERVLASRGRAALDTALAAVAETLSRHTRGGDFVGRYSDYEFVVLLPDESLVQTRIAATRLVEAAEHTSVLAPATSGSASRLGLRFQVGIAAAPQHGQTADALLAAADAGLRRYDQTWRAA